MPSPSVESNPDRTEDPTQHDTWLTRLSPEEQRKLRERWNARTEEQASRSRRECRRALVDHLAVIASFGAADLLHGWTGGLSLFTALGLGAFLGGLILVLEAPRTLALTMAGPGLLFHQWIVRGGLTLAEVATLLPFLVVFWLVGRRREARHWQAP